MALTPTFITGNGIGQTRRHRDVNDPLSDYYNEYLPYQKKLDVLGMAEQKILQIPLQMVDPINRNIVVIGSSIQVVVYNKTLIHGETALLAGGPQEMLEMTELLMKDENLRLRLVANLQQYIREERCEKQMKEEWLSAIAG